MHPKLQIVLCCLFLYTLYGCNVYTVLTFSFPCFCFTKIILEICMFLSYVLDVQVVSLISKAAEAELV